MSEVVVSSVNIESFITYRPAENPVVAKSSKAQGLKALWQLQSEGYYVFTSRDSLFVTAAMTRWRVS